jgi:tetratricopeptide (TPR) repeat protein
MSEFWRSRVIGQLQRDSAIGALKLGALLRRHGDLQGAEAAFRRADKRGDAEAALSLGELLERRGQLAGAEAAFERAIERAKTQQNPEVLDAATRALRGLGRGPDRRASVPVALVADRGAPQVPLRLKS